MDGMTRRTDSVWFRALVALGVLLLFVIASMATSNEPRESHAHDRGGPVAAAVDHAPR